MKINFFWIGDTLPKVSQLSLKSFIDNNHEVILWTYNKNCKNIPSGTIIENAEEILPRTRIFHYNGLGDCRFGSYGGFSDIFRYYLLQKVGGWYCDTDVTCLKNFDSIPNNDYVFKPYYHGATGNVLKTPSNNEFLKSCIEKTENEINENNKNWVKPVVIFSEMIKKHNLENFIVDKSLFGDDTKKDLYHYFEIGYTKNKIQLPEYAIHWSNEYVTTGAWDVDIKRNLEKPIPTTLYYKLLKKHNLL